MSPTAIGFIVFGSVLSYCFIGGAVYGAMLHYEYGVDTIRGTKNVDNTMFAAAFWPFTLIFAIPTQTIAQATKQVLDEREEVKKKKQDLKQKMLESEEKKLDKVIGELEKDELDSAIELLEE